MGVDHRGFHVLVAEEFLHSACGCVASVVVVILQEVGGKAVAEGVGCNPFGDAGLLGSLLDSFLHTILVEAMATDHVTARVL